MTTTSTVSNVSAGLSWLLPIALVGQAAAQCGVGCVPGGRVPDADGAVNASCTWDPDGPGPQPAVVVLGGDFQVVGTVVARGLALFDPGTGDCSSLGVGVSGRVTALAVLPNNDLVVAGTFQSIDGVAAANIARWNGAAWLPMATGLTFAPNALTAMPNGDVVVAGASSTGPRVLRWNGTNWGTMGTGLTGTVWALAAMPNGDVIAGGSLVLPGSNINLARWDGVSWSVFAGNTDGGVLALLALPNGDLIAGGGFLNAGGVATSSIARWNGTTWSSVGGGIFNPVYALANLPNGDLVVGGLFQSAGGVPANQVARWDGTAWSGMGSGLGIPTVNPAPVRSLLALPNGDVVAGGSFRSTGGDADYVARWNGTAWTQIRSGTGGAVLASAEAANGDLLVVGDFTTIEGVPANRVARRSGGIWQALGSGADGSVQAVLPMPNGDIVIGGAFTSVGGVAANRIARWDGTQWWPIGGGLPATVTSLAIGAGPQILASGTFLDRVAVWDGQAWNGTGIAGSTVGTPALRLLTLADGSVFAPGVGRWNGIVWMLVPGVSGTSGLLGLDLAPNGDWFGNFGTSVRRWNGTAWVTLGGTFNGTIADLIALPNGDLLAGGSFTAIANVPFARLARWNGTAWSPVGAGASAAIADLRFGTNGRAFVSGSFTSLVGVSCASFGELATTCPATAATAGSGCTGSGGANALAATSLPWTGATFTSLATGMPANGLAIEVLGLGALSQPLPAVLPQGVAGCVLATTPDLLNLRVPAAGALPLQLVLPDSASLVGASLRQQVVPFEIDALGAIAAVTATNALQLTIGRF